MPSHASLLFASLSAFVARVCLLCALSGAPAWGEGRPSLVVASSVNNPPYEYVDMQGRPSGYVNDVMRAVAEAQGMDLEIRPMRWAELMEAFQKGEVAAVTGMVQTDERLKTMDFTVPHSSVPYVVILGKGVTGIRSERDLAGRKLVVLGRSVMADYLRSHGIPFREMPTHEDSILELAAGKAEAAVVPKYTWLFFAKTRSIRGVTILPSEIFPTKRCFAVHKGDTALLAKLNEGLFALKSNGKLDQIYYRHLGVLEGSELPMWVAARRMAGVALPLVLGLGLVGLLAWSISLRHLVRLRTEDLRAELQRRLAAEREREHLMEELARKNQDLEQLVGKLQEALAEVKQLSGLIPICAQCKRVRDDHGYWQAVEGYIAEHSEASFTHGLCPECIGIYFPDFKSPREA